MGAVTCSNPAHISVALDCRAAAAQIIAAVCAEGHSLERELARIKVAHKHRSRRR